MMPLSQTAVTRPVSKLADETELPFWALLPPTGVTRVCGLTRIAPQPVTGPHARPHQLAWPNPVNVEAEWKQRSFENLELLMEKAVTDYGSSGGSHDPNSVSLFAMVHEFIENDDDGEQRGYIMDGPSCLTSNKEKSKADGLFEVPKTIQTLARCEDGTEEILLADVQCVLNAIASEVRPLCDGKVATIAHSCLKRKVMDKLQRMGHIAAICKTKWDHCCGIPAGDYEFIDVLVPSGAPSNQPERLLVDIYFQAQFEIARPIDEFTATLQSLPPIFVGRAERLKQIIQIMSEATKQSMQCTGLHLPPWRKSGYLMAKWFSCYKRIAGSNLGRPCSEAEYRGKALGLAVRGGGLDAKYTNTVEILYHDSRRSKVLAMAGDVGMPRRERDEITVMLTDWQPPAMVPRCVAPSKAGTIRGLTSVLLNTGAPPCNDRLVQAA